MGDEASTPAPDVGGTTMAPNGPRPSGLGGRITTEGRTVARLARQVDQALGGTDLSAAQYRVLAFLSEVDGAAAGALAGRLQVTPPSVTGLIDGLVARGLVERRPCDDDRRRVSHHLTPAGEVALGAADAAVHERLVSLVGAGDEDLARRALDGLDAWAELLQRSWLAHLEQHR